MLKKITVIAVTMSALTCSCINYVCAREWNNPENKKRYENAQRETAKAYQNEAKAWSNYDSELSRAERDVKKVRDESLKGAVKGGAAGAALGVAKGASESIYQRAKESVKKRK